MKRPWMQLFTRDWLDNKELRRCLPESRSVLIDLMCLASEGNPFGFLADDIGPLKDEYMASRCAMTVSKFRRCLSELIQYERVTKTKDTLMIPRMVRDEEIKLARINAGKTGGNPNLVVNQTDNRKVNHDANHLPDTRAHTRSDSDSEVLKALLPEQQRDRTEVPVSSISTEEFEIAWERHRKHRRDQTKYLSIQQVLSMNGKFSVDRFRERHPEYCQYWNRENSWKFCPLSFLDWIEADMPWSPDGGPKKPTIRQPSAQEKSRFWTQELMSQCDSLQGDEQAEFERKTQAWIDSEFQNGESAG